MNSMELILFTIMIIAIFVLIYLVIKVLKTLKHLPNENNTNYNIKTENILVHSPIKTLPYEDALNIQTFHKHLVNNALVNLNESFLMEFGGKDISYLNNISSSIKRYKNGNIVWELSDKGKKLIKSGKAKIVYHTESGKLLPTIQDARTNQFMEQFKGKLPNVGSKIAKLSNIVVNTAHIISGADISKKLKVIDKKVDLLIAGRKIDQLSKIESNYNLARELLSEPLNQNDISTLKYLHKEIMELRSVWRQEIELKLTYLEDPHNINWVKKMFSKQKSRDQKVIQKICEFEKELRLIDFSIAYDLGLCQSIGNTNAFVYTSLPDEINRLNKIRFIVQEKAKFIREQSADDSVKSVISYFKYICEKYSGFVPLEISTKIKSIKELLD